MDKKKITKSSTKAKNKYNKAHYIQLNLRLPPEIVNRLKLYCNCRGISQREFTLQAIEEKLKRDEEQQGNEI